MSLLLLGYFLLLSLTEGSNIKAFTCSPGRLMATCDAGKVILIGRVFRGYYGGAFDGSHCKHQVGDGIETGDRDSKDVWKDCNRQRQCSVPFIRSGNYYLEMHYECDANFPITLGIGVPLLTALIIVSAIVLWRNGCIARICICHSGENTNNAAQNDASVTPGIRPGNENLGVDYENVSGSSFINHAFIGGQTPGVSNISDIGNSSYINVPDIATNSTDNHNQRMPTYENVEPNERSQGAGVSGTDTRRQEAPAPTDGGHFPYAEIGVTGASMPRALGEEAETPYAKLDPVERSEYLDLRHIGLAGAAADTGEKPNPLTPNLIQLSAQNI